MNSVRFDLTTIFQEFLPPWCLLASAGLIVAGLGVPLLMALGLIPVTLALGFIGLALAATGGTLVLVFCGEI